MKKTGFFPGWYLVAASWVMLFLVNGVAVGIFFKPILDEFGIDRAALSLVYTIAVLVFAAVIPFWGGLIDRFGPKATLYACVGTQTLTSVVNGTAAGLWQLGIGRFLFEIKGMHAAQVLVNRWFVKQRGLAQGIVATGTPVGAIILSPLSQYLVMEWGWRSTLLFWAVITFVILLPLTFFLKDSPESSGLAPDGGQPGQAAGNLKSGSGGNIAETPDAGQESLDLKAVIRQSSFWLLSGTQLFCGVSCGFMATHIVIFATDMGYSEMIGATFLSIQGVANLVGVLLTGYLSDRFARNRVLGITHFIRSLSFIILIITVFYGGGSLWMLYTAMAMFGFGWFTTAPLSSGLVADLFGYRRMGLLIGVILCCHMVGTAIGAYSGGVVYDLTGSYHRLFYAQASLELLAAVFAFIIKQKAVR